MFDFLVFPTFQEKGGDHVGNMWGFQILQKWLRWKRFLPENENHSLGWGDAAENSVTNMENAGTSVILKTFYKSELRG